MPIEAGRHCTAGYYIYIYIHTYIICIYIYICTCVRMYVYVHIHSRICITKLVPGALLWQKGCTCISVVVGYVWVTTKSVPGASQWEEGCTCISVACAGCGGNLSPAFS